MIAPIGKKDRWEIILPAPGDQNRGQPIATVLSCEALMSGFLHVQKSFAEAQTQKVQIQHYDAMQKRANHEVMTPRNR